MLIEIPEARHVCLLNFVYRELRDKKVTAVDIPRGNSEGITFFVFLFGKQINQIHALLRII